jgi:CubicO group peptidase (beta-lactamase class C family)
VTNPGVDPERCADLVAPARRDVEGAPLASGQLAVARDGPVVLFETIGAAARASRYVTVSVTTALVAAAAGLLIGDGPLDPSSPIAAWGLSLCFLTNGLDANVISEGRRRTALANRAGALADSGSTM